MNLIEVNKEEFFATMNPLNVHPRIVNNWDKEIGYLQNWEMQDSSRRLVGKSQSGTKVEGCDKDGIVIVSNKKFWLVK